MIKPSVLIVDDDQKLAKLLETYFDKEGFAVQLAHEGRQALSAAFREKPDIIVLDLMLPGLDGWEICRRLREASDIPILMLTARDAETDRLTGLELGADDYVVKPFSPREVVARAKAILRRTHRLPTYQKGIIEAGGLVIDTVRHIASCRGRELELTPTEFKLLELMAESPGQVFSRLQLVEQVQGYAFDGYERTIDAHIKNLRRKVEESPKEPKLIQTVYGVGYKFAGDSHA